MDYVNAPTSDLIVVQPLNSICKLCHLVAGRFIYDLIICQHGSKQEEV